LNRAFDLEALTVDRRSTLKLAWHAQRGAMRLNALVIVMVQFDAMRRAFLSAVFPSCER
jgi:hypothetical protein